MAESDIPAKKPKTEEDMVILVTGGGGLVGMGLKSEAEKVKSPNEQWIFLRSADGDLRWLYLTIKISIPLHLVILLIVCLSHGMHRVG